MIVRFCVLFLRCPKKNGKALKDYLFIKLTPLFIL